ncbi:MAG: patatin family protein [Clostridiales bacterium]|nr:patatin family protein [Clostridiales bacterium]
MYQAGLILEGGGMRGVYTAGVLDAFLEEDIEFSSVYGVSAGSCHACSYLSKQKGRAYRVNVNYLDDPRYCSIRSYLKTGDMFGADMLYSKIPDVLDPYDHKTFEKYKGTFYAVLTDVDSGKAVYVPIKDLKRQIWAIRASSSLPLISRTVNVQGSIFQDGGVADSIPILKSIKDGNQKNVVILTREKGYKKGINALMPLMRLRYPSKKEFLHKSENRYIAHNKTVDFLEKEEKAGNVFLFRPEEKVEVGRLEKDRDKLDALYHIGLEDGRRSMDALKGYLEK